MQLPVTASASAVAQQDGGFSDIVGATIPMDAYVIGHGMQTTYRKDNFDNDGYTDTEHRVNYTRCEDAANPENQRFLESRTTRITIASTRTITSALLPPFAHGLKNPPPHSVMEGGAELPQEANTLPSADPVEGSPQQAAALFLSSPLSSVPSTPTNAAQGGTSQHADSEGGGSNSTDSSIWFSPQGPLEEATTRRHQYFEDMFERLQQANQQQNNTTVPVEASLTNSGSAAAISSSNVNAPLNSGEYLSRETTPLSEIDLSDLFTPDTVRVMKEIDAMVDNGIPTISSPLLRSPFRARHHRANSCSVLVAPRAAPIDPVLTLEQPTFTLFGNQHSQATISAPILATPLTTLSRASGSMSATVASSSQPARQSLRLQASPSAHSASRRKGSALRVPLTSERSVVEISDDDVEVIKHGVKRPSPTVDNGKASMKKRKL